MQQENAFIEKQANDWLVKLETGSLADGDEERFVAWLEEDEKHGVAFDEAEKTWKLMHEVKSGQIDPVTTEPSASKNVVSLINRFMPLAATVLLTFSVLFWYQDAYIALVADHSTATGQRTEQRLPDGSMLTLNTDSAVDVRFTENERVLEVISGEVYVSVAPDKQRPFMVEAGEMRVTALGTAFIIRNEGDSAPTVTVTQHKVKVESMASPGTQVELDEGQKVSLIAEDQLTDIIEVESRYEQAWLQGKYVFRNQRFEDVVKELERYHKGKILINDPLLKNAQISGVLDLDDPLTALENLADTLPFQVNTLTPYLILIDKS